MKLNEQPFEKNQSHLDGLFLDVIKVWLTIQGEGPFAGHRAVFVRLAGCDLQCPLCDTEYTTGRNLIGIKSIHFAIDTVAKAGTGFIDGRKTRTRLVVITGGEPFRQNLLPLIVLLVNKGFHPQIETNGTMWQDVLFSNEMRQLASENKYTVVCSPKTSYLHPALPVHAFKYVLRAGYINPEDGLPTSALGNNTQPARPPAGYNGPIYVQPCDEQDEKANADNVKACVESSLKFGYLLCLQMHKYAGLE